MLSKLRESYCTILIMEAKRRDEFPVLRKVKLADFELLKTLGSGIYEDNHQVRLAA